VHGFIVVVLVVVDVDVLVELVVLVVTSAIIPAITSKSSQLPFTPE
jgi:hypothetical protein